MNITNNYDPLNNKEDIIIKSYHVHGDLALCNLASVNVKDYYHSSKEERKEIAKAAVTSLDLAISVGEFPVLEGQITNDEFRYMGIGVLNLANLLASEKIIYDSQEALEFVAELMDDLSFDVYTASMELAKELGKFPRFDETKWAQGLTPVHMSLEHFPQTWQLTEYGRNFVSSGKFERWQKLGEDIAKFGIRNAQVMSIAPTANSSKAINQTESKEPVHALMYKEEGVFSVPALAPNIRENHPYYKPAFECNQYKMIEMTAIMQSYLDQAISHTVYLKKADSLKEMTDLHIHGWNLGMKTFYYLKQQKGVELDECVACAV